ELIQPSHRWPKVAQQFLTSILSLCERGEADACHFEDLNAPTFPLLLDRGEDEREESKLEAASDYVAFLRNICLSLVSLVNEAAPKQTPLYDEHVRLGAKIVPFAGWLMPVQYTSIMEEHQAVRDNVGMFDISHMGQLVVAATPSSQKVGGEGAAATWLNTMLTNNIDKLDIGMGQYTFLLNESGGIIDDLMVYRTGEDTFLLVVNAARTEEDFAWLQSHLKAGRSPDRPNGGLPASAKPTAGGETAAPCTLANRSAEFGGVAIQGPRVVELFHALFGR